jgi:hypothetical protein
MTQAYNLSQFANKVNTSGQADLTTAITGLLPRINGGTGLSTVGTSGNVLTSNGTNWVSSPVGNAATVTNGVYTSNFTGSNQSLTSNGYQKFPGGLIVQWGTSPVISGDSGVAITFPIPFSVVYAITTTAIVAVDGRDAGCYTRLITTTGFRMTNGDGVAQAGMWIAVGI